VITIILLPFCSCGKFLHLGHIFFLFIFIAIFVSLLFKVFFLWRFIFHSFSFDDSSSTGFFTDSVEESCGIFGPPVFCVFRWGHGFLSSCLLLWLRCSLFRESMVVRFNHWFQNESYIRNHKISRDMEYALLNYKVKFMHSRTFISYCQHQQYEASLSENHQHIKHFKID